jgi:ubiquinone/menaquinone biosynthesis C-methylase UbiE
MLMREQIFKRRLIEQMAIRPGQRILDLGCGTGTMAILIKQQHPDSQVVGLDPDATILDIAKGKATRAKVEVRFDRGFADRLPYADSSFDRVTSSLVFHHLNRAAKREALRQAYRVLRPGGQLHIADVGEASSRVMRFALTPIILLDGADRVGDNVAGRIPVYMKEANFVHVDEAESFKTWFGPIALYRATKPL